MVVVYGRGGRQYKRVRAESVVAYANRRQIARQVQVVAATGTMEAAAAAAAAAE